MFHKKHPESFQIRKEDIIQFMYQEHSKYIPEEIAMSLRNLMNDFVGVIMKHATNQAVSVGFSESPERMWSMFVGYAGFVSKFYTYKIETKVQPQKEDSYVPLYE